MPISSAGNWIWRAVAGRMPPDIELTVEQMTPSVFPIMSVVLTGGDSPSQLRDYAFYELAPRIKNIPDVLYANVAGGDLREIEVVARPDNLLAADLSAADLADQIGRARRPQPVGRSKARRSPARSSSARRRRAAVRFRTWSSPRRTASPLACATWPT